MVDLLSGADRNDIRDAFRDIMETFSRTPVTIRRAGASVDRFNEDRTDIVYTDYSVLAIVIYGAADKKNDPNLGGAVDVTNVRAVVHLDLLEAVGLLDSEGLPTINETTDLLVVNGQQYRIKEVSVSAQFEKRQTKATIRGQIETTYYP